MKILKLSMVLAMVLPAGTLLARDHASWGGGTRIVRVYSDGWFRSYPVERTVVTERTCAAPVVRLERETVLETRTIGGDGFHISFTRPVVQYREVIEQTCENRTVVYEQPRCDAPVVIYTPPVREKVIVVKEQPRYEVSRDRHGEFRNTRVVFDKHDRHNDRDRRDRHDDRDKIRIKVKF